MGRVTINGVSYEGSNITVNGNQVTVDGTKVESGQAGVMTVKVEGDLLNLTTDKSVNVLGTIHGNLHAGGSVNCDDVDGNVSAGGSVNCDNVGGSVTAGGMVLRG
jgi:cytoskeletal protein CcmA (bactofilin family)